MMYWYDHGGGGWGWFAMMLGIVLFWGLIILVGVLLFRAFARPAPRGGGGERTGWHLGPASDVPPTPERILAERYARGEIEDEEYERRLAMLRSSRGGPAAP